LQGDILNPLDVFIFFKADIAHNPFAIGLQAGAFEKIAPLGDKLSDDFFVKFLLAFFIFRKQVGMGGLHKLCEGFGKSDEGVGASAELFLHDMAYVF
jgi:hypothetical protein